MSDERDLLSQLLFPGDRGARRPGRPRGTSSRTTAGEVVGRGAGGAGREAWDEQPPP